VLITLYAVQGWVVRLAVFIRKRAPFLRRISLPKFVGLWPPSNDTEGSLRIIANYGKSCHLLASRHGKCGGRCVSTTVIASRKSESLEICTASPSAQSRGSCPWLFPFASQPWMRRANTCEQRYDLIDGLHIGEHPRRFHTREAAKAAVFDYIALSSGPAGVVVAETTASYRQHCIRLRWRLLFPLRSWYSTIL
jgi:hypothetical protein